MAEGKKKEGVFRAYRGTFTVLIILVVLIACYLLGPVRFCYVPSGSMEPNLPTWSFCVVNRWAPYDKLEVGDIIVYDRISDGLRIIHRVIAVTDEGLVTKGDANRVDDGLSTNEFNYFGKYLFHVPLLGKAIALAKTRAGMAVMGAVFLGILVWMISDDAKEKKKEREDTQKEGPEAAPAQEPEGEPDRKADEETPREGQGP